MFIYCLQNDCHEKSNLLWFPLHIKEALFFIKLKLKNDFAYDGIIGDIEEIYENMRAFSKEMYVKVN